MGRYYQLTSYIIQPGSQPYLAYSCVDCIFDILGPQVNQLTASYYYVSNWYYLSKQVHRPKHGCVSQHVSTPVLLQQGLLAPLQVQIQRVLHVT